MNDQTRNTINILTTILGIVGIYVYLNPKVKDKKLLAGYVAVGGIASYIAISQITNLLADSLNKPKTDQPINDASDNPDWDPTATTDAIHAQTYNSWYANFQGDNNLDAYNNIISLGNTGLQAVYDDWLDRYWGEYDETLTAALQADSIYWAVGNGSSAIVLRDSLINRLTDIGLN